MAGRGSKYYQVRKRSPKKDKPYLGSELAADTTAIYKRMELTPYMADELLEKKKISVYNQMYRDEEIAAALDEIKLMRLQTGWHIKSSSNNPEDIEKRDFVEYNLENIDGSFDDDLRELMDAHHMGVSLAEMIFNDATEIGVRGRWAEKILLTAIKSKNLEFYNLWTDDFDNIQEWGVVNISSLDFGRHYPADKFIIYSFNKRYENIWGVSKIRPLYTLWYIKQMCIRAWGIYCEKFGHPFPVFSYKNGIDPTTKNYLDNIIKQIRYETGFTIPDNVKFEFAEASKTAGDAHEALLRYINQQIRKTIQGQTATSGSDEKGTMGRAVAGQHILEDYIEFAGRDLAEKVVNKQIIKKLIDYNYNDTEFYPEFEWNEQTDNEVSVDKRIEIYGERVADKTIKPTPEDEKWIRLSIGAPERDVDKDPAEAITDPNAVPAKPDTGNRPPPIHATESAEHIEFAEKKKENIFTGVDRRRFTTYETECVNFTEVKKTIEDTQRTYTVMAGKIIKYGIDDMLKNINNKNIIQTKNMDAIKTIVFPARGDLKNIFNDMLKETYKKGETTAKGEISKIKRVHRFTEEHIIRFGQDMDFRKINPTEAINFFDNKAFTMSGIEGDGIQNTIKIILMNAIKTGASISDVVDEIQDQTSEYYDPEQVDDDAFTGARLSTVVRTNMVEAFSEGRKSFFEAPEMDGYVQAYQDSAIMDARVRPNHAKMDGRIYPINSIVWKIWNLPYGFNCRCYIIPITKGQEWTESPALPASLRPDDGFVGAGF